MTVFSEDCIDGVVSVSLRFMLRHLDSDLMSMQERTVPPVDLSQVAAFNAALGKHAKQASRQRQF